MLSKLIEESYILHESKNNPTVQKWDNEGNVAERVGGALATVPLLGGYLATGSRMISGYQAGKATGHPVAGTLLGREAALGAASKHDNDISLGDVYTKNNMINKAALAAGNLGGMALASDIFLDDPTEMFKTAPGALAAGVIATSPLVTPAMSYGLGKVFGSRTPAYQPQQQPQQFQNKA